MARKPLSGAADFARRLSPSVLTLEASAELRAWLGDTFSPHRAWLGAVLSTVGIDPVDAAIYRDYRRATAHAAITDDVWARLQAYNGWFTFQVAGPTGGLKWMRGWHPGNRNASPRMALMGREKSTGEDYFLSMRWSDAERGWLNEGTMKNDPIRRGEGLPYIAALYDGPAGEAAMAKVLTERPT